MGWEGEGGMWGGKERVVCGMGRRGWCVGCRDGRRGDQDRKVERIRGKKMGSNIVSTTLRWCASIPLYSAESIVQ